MQKISPLKGAAVVVAIAVVVVCYILLASQLKLPEFWAGFLWLFYWAGIEHMNFERFADSVTGALVGLLTALALHVFPEQAGTAGLVGALGIVVLLVYCSVMGWMKMLVNNATMLFLTVATVPAIQSSVNFSHVFGALLVGVVFFGGLLWLGSVIGRRLASKPV